LLLHLGLTEKAMGDLGLPLQLLTLLRSELVRSRFRRTFSSTMNLSPS
jgi:hypothetical protein